MVVPGDVGDRASLDAAMEGVDAAYYLVHAMGAHRRVRRSGPAVGAETSVTPPPPPGSSQIVYLGGLGRRLDRLVRAPAQSPRRRRGPRRRSGSGHRTARRRHHRFGERELRDAASPHRRAAGDGRRRVGCARAASRSRSATCSPTSSACSAHPRRAGEGVRDRRPRRRHLRGDDAAVRRRRGPASRASWSRCRC